jgi:hypothetical protein
MKKNQNVSSPQFALKRRAKYALETHELRTSSKNQKTNNNQTKREHGG